MEISTRALGAVYRKSIHPSDLRAPLTPAPPNKFESEVLDGGEVLFEKDHAIPMRDSIKLYADILRPVDSIAKPTPTIVFFGPFGKHGAVPRELFKNMDVDFSKLSKYTKWELPDPLLWCGKYGYSFVIVDPRGTWWSEGDAAHYLSPEEGRDGYDVVEWIAKQPWSTGKVGWGAVSYFAMSAYQTAVLHPPHLAAIMPWEGISDLYREVNTVGGMPNLAFQQMWMNLTGNGLHECEDHAVASIEHPLYDAWWQSKVVDWSQIHIPAFSVTGWSSLGLHLRGTIEAWNKFSSEKKYLWVHAGREWSEYYKDTNVQKQKLFWDRFLKGQANEVDSWAPVEIQIRYTADAHIARLETTFPPSKARLSKFWITGPATLSPTSSGSKDSPPASLSYQAHHADSNLTFQYVFPEQTEITGHSSVKLWIQAMSYPDADLYLALQKLDTSGKEVKFYHSTQQIEAPATLGWLRVSHRELDPERSISGRPYHKHAKRQWLRPRDIVPVDVELWPQGTIWKKGETMRLSIQGRSFTDPDNPTQAKSPVHGFGEVKIWYGGEYDSALLVPIVDS